MQVRLWDASGKPAVGAFRSPESIHFGADGFAYLGDQDRVIKVNATTGEFVGWIGAIDTAGGTCAGSYGAFTGGWCVGGNSGGWGDWQDPKWFSNFGAIAVGSDGYVYVATEYRINRYRADTGAFAGWIGESSTAPTPSVTCTGGAYEFTGGWCMDGAPTYSWSTVDGALYSVPSAIALGTDGFLYVVDRNNQRVNKYVTSTGAFVGWIGLTSSTPDASATCTGSAGGFTGGWCKGGSPSGGTGDGMFYYPQGLALGSDGSLYVTEDQSHRISKFNASTGAFIGWIGKIATAPNASATCTGSAGGFTGGWCTGGTSTYGSDDGMLYYPRGITAGGDGYIYASDYYNQRISKYHASTGAFVGWIGNIGTPAVSPKTCTGASGTSTGGWCTGGSAAQAPWNPDSVSGGLSYPTFLWSSTDGFLYVKSGDIYGIKRYQASTGAFDSWFGHSLESQIGWTQTEMAASSGENGDGFLNSPQDVVRDPTGNLYVADSNNGRVVKYSSTGAFIGWIGSLSPKNLAIDNAGYLYVSDPSAHRVSKFRADTGAFVGWLGRISSAATPSATCTGGVGQFSGGWCTDGNTNAGSADGMLYGPEGVAVDSNGYLYVADKYNHRISKYVASTGQFVGWLGRVYMTGVGCDAIWGEFTGKWCTGASSTSGNYDGALNSPSGVSVSQDGYLYVADSSNHRVMKYNAGTGEFIGWIGRIYYTGGTCDEGPQKITKKWCQGGTSTNYWSTHGDGDFHTPKAVSVGTDGYLYVIDTNSRRVSRFNASTGAFTGWFGGIATRPKSGHPLCATAAIGTVTPGWCTGGASSEGDSNGMFKNPAGLHAGSDGFLYVSDSNLHRIMRIGSSGGGQ